MQHEIDLREVQSKQLASAYLLEQVETCVQSTEQELSMLNKKCATLRNKVKGCPRYK